MKTITLRKAGLCSCMVLALLSGMPFGAAPARSQTILDVLTGNNTGGAINTTTNADGSTTTQNADGSTTTVKPGGVTQITYPNGTGTTINPDGSAVNRAADGTVTTKDAAGNVTATNPNGTTSYYNASNGTVTSTNNGVTTTNYPNGTSSTSSSGGGNFLGNIFSSLTGGTSGSNANPVASLFGNTGTTGSSGSSSPNLLGGLIGGLTGSGTSSSSSSNPLGGLIGGLTGSGSSSSSNPLGGLLGGLTGSSTTGTQGTSFFQNTATSGLSSLVSGQGNIGSIASLFSSNSAAGSGATTQQFSGILGNLMGNSNVNPQSAVGLLGGVMSGSISPNLASSLSSIPGLGNISSASGLSSALSGLTGSIGGLGSTAQQAGGLSTALSALTGSNGASLLGTAGATSAVASQFPGLTQALGGTGGLQQALAGLGQQIGGAAGGVVGGLIGGLLGGGSGLASTVASATGSVTGSGGGTKGCAGQGCCKSCEEIPKHYQDVRDHVSSEFKKHQTWFITTYWLENILPALMMMAEQLTVAGIHQIEIIGTLLDAKHQMETQRLFGELTAQAHKDYQPSEGMCTFGSTVRSLAASERKSDIAQLAFAQRMNQRQMMSGKISSQQGVSSDMRSRLKAFISTYCDQADDANGLSKLCPSATPTASRRNIDVDYTRNIESRLTLDIDYAPNGDGASDSENKPDAEDVFALSSNLFSHNIAPQIPAEFLGDGKGQVRITAAEKLLDLRAVYAKRSVAQNSFAAIAAMRTSGDSTSAPYTKALIKELGVDKTEDIEKLLGKNPSYFAQMEVLTKKLYQNPTFYTELYDKPTNVDRKGAALQAIGLMQDRDLYNSLLRSEAVLSVLLETMLQKEQDKITDAQRTLGRSGGSR